MTDALKCPLCDYPFPRDGEGTDNCMGKREHGGYTLWECTNEGSHPPVLLSWQWDSLEAYEAFYTEDLLYHEREAQKIGTDSFWHRDSEYLEANYQRLRWIDASRPPLADPSFLDIGTGTGALPSMARAVFGGLSLGYEPNPSMVAQGQCLGRPVKRGTWKDAGKALEDGLTYNDLSRGIGAAAGVWYRDTLWDIISLSDVLEHLVFPAECLEHLRECLQPGGVLYVEMPEWDGDAANKHIKPRQHVCLYSRDAAEMLYERCGYRVFAFQRPLQGTIAKMAHILMRR